MEQKAPYWINALQLTRHVEGGWFKETYRSPETIRPGGSSLFLSSARAISTSIYFLLQKGEYSAFHRIRSDEQWHFYTGDPLTIYEILPEGTLREHHLGNDPGKGCVFQTTITAGNWFASKVAEGGDFSLVGCTVAPGFDFTDFELGERSALVRAFPAFRSLIEELTSR